MTQSNTPSTGAAQPDDEAASRHTPSEPGGLSVGGSPDKAPMGAPPPSDFGRPGSKGPDVERGTNPLTDKPAERGPL